MDLPDTKRGQWMAFPLLGLRSLEAYLWPHSLGSGRPLIRFG